MRLHDARDILSGRVAAMVGPVKLAVQTMIEEIDRKIDFGEPPPQISIDNLDEISPVSEEDEDGSRSWPGGRIGALCNAFLHVASEFGQHNMAADAFVWAARDEQRLLTAEIRRLRGLTSDLLASCEAMETCGPDASDEEIHRIAEQNRTAIGKARRTP